MKKYLKKLVKIFKVKFSKKSKLPFYSQEKYLAEISFWRQILKSYVKWYQGEIEELYQEKSPRRIKKSN